MRHSNFDFKQILEDYFFNIYYYYLHKYQRFNSTSNSLWQYKS